MKTFTVFVPEVHYQAMKIEAEDEAAARKAVLEGAGESENQEYSHTIDNDREKWRVEERRT